VLVMRGFQYPQPDRIVCNLVSVQLLLVHSFSFSIRNRIELSATFKNRDHQLNNRNFQYPQPDRIVCNQ